MSNLINSLIKLKNAYSVGKSDILIAKTRKTAPVFQLLLDEGYVESVEEHTNGLNVKLRYINGNAAIKELKVLSTPGRRRYCGHEDIPPFKSGLGLTLISTSQGVKTDVEARRDRTGGELLLSVF